MLEKLREFFNRPNKARESSKPNHSALDMILDKEAKSYGPTDLSLEQIAQELRNRRVVRSDEEVQRALSKIEAIR